MSLRSLTLVALICAPNMIIAEVPRVAVDVPAVHSLVTQVMGDLGAPRAFMSPTASPHGYSLRPSEAAILAESNLVIWSGAQLVPQIPDMLTSLAPNAVSLELMSQAGTETLAMRAFEDFGGEHGDDHDHDHDHDHSDPIDPHAWLDPHNGVAWLGMISEALSSADPDNAQEYARNAKMAADQLLQTERAIAERIAPVKGRTFATSHDAFQYFENHFGLRTVATVSLANGGQPGARQLAKIRETLAQSKTRCILADTRESTVLLGAVAESSNVSTAAVDPVGGDLPPGADLYASLLNNIATALIDCLSD